MADPLTVLAGVLICTFTTASIDGRAAFDSVLEAQAVPVADTPGLVMLTLDDTPPRIAAIQRNADWISLRGAPDPDHGGRMTVLDVAQQGPLSGDAVLVEMDLQSAAGTVTRTGTCRIENAE